MEKTCSTCGSKTAVYGEFPCPNCGKAKLIRCKHCRSINNSYKCPECGFEGP